MLQQETISPATPRSSALPLALPRVSVYALIGWVIVFAAIAASTLSFIHYNQMGDILAYPDAQSHLEIPHRVLFGLVNGMGQLGGVWPILQHSLSLTLIWNDTLYRNGLAGSVFAMAAYVGSVWFLYRLTFAAVSLWAKKQRTPYIAGIIAAGVFGANLNVLYMQSTPMDELLMIFFFVAGFYYLFQWTRTPENLRYLYIIGGISALVSLTRYEGWLFPLFALSVIVPVYLWRRHGWRKTEDRIVLFSILGFFGIVFWLGWNTVFFQNPLYFIDSKYAKSSNWVSSSDITVHHLGLSMQVYVNAVHRVTSPIIFVAACVGICCWLGKTRLRRELLAPLGLLIFYPFFVAMLFLGMRPLHMEVFGQENYNVRFALCMVPAAAFYCGVLAASIETISLGAVAVITAIVGGTLTFLPNHIITLNEPLAFAKRPETVLSMNAADWFRNHYTEGRVLMESYGNEIAMYNSQIPENELVYEGANPYWTRALNDPASSVTWVYVNKDVTTGTDTVWLDMVEHPDRFTDFDVVFKNKNIEILHRHVALAAAVSQ